MLDELYKEGSQYLLSGTAPTWRYLKLPDIIVRDEISPEISLLHLILEAIKEWSIEGLKWDDQLPALRGWLEGEDC